MAFRNTRDLYMAAYTPDGVVNHIYGLPLTRIGFESSCCGEIGGLIWGMEVEYGINRISDTPKHMHSGFLSLIEYRQLESTPLIM